MSDLKIPITDESRRRALQAALETYPPPNADERRIMARLDALERKVDQILALLKANPSPPDHTTS